LVRDVIVRDEERIKLLAKNIFDVIKIIKSHSLQLNKERFDLNEEIRNVINDIKSQARFNSVSIIFEPKQDVFVEADKVRIYEVISNLLKTAIQWTKEYSITIVAAEEEKVDYNGIRVSITGKGIDPEIWEDWRPRLFRKFATEYVVDTGFGLFISKSIIEAHGGKIWAENNADGKGGATFVFTIPLQAGGKASK
jgi:signal transduction histidine kinase